MHKPAGTMQSQFPTDRPAGLIQQSQLLLNTPAAHGPAIDDRSHQVQALRQPAGFHRT